MSVQFDCLCVGLIVVDHLCTPLPRMPDPGELMVAERLFLSIGGCAANASVCLAKVGVNVAVVGTVGSDAFGDYAINFLSQAGVQTQTIRRHTELGTAASLILNIDGQDRRFIHDRGANAAVSVEDFDWAAIAQTKVLYLGGFMMMPRLCQPGTLSKVLRRARELGVRTVMDVVLPGRDDYWPIFAEVLPEVDVFLPNTDEARVITGLTDPLAQAEKFRSAGARTVAITCGEQGAVMLSDELRVRSGIYPVPYVGGTGSGDAFDAGFIAGMIAGEDMLGCLRWGSALGASCVRSVSATDGVFDRAEALDFMQSHKLPIQQL